jgi:hypothetical protein
MMAFMTDPFEKSVAVDAKVKPPEDVVNIRQQISSANACALRHIWWIMGTGLVVHFVKMNH